MPGGRSWSRRLGPEFGELTGTAGSPAWVHLTWLIASTVLLGSVALWATRREAVTRRG